MANNLGSLVVSLGLDAAEFTRGLTKSEYQTQQWVRRFETGVEAVRTAALGSFAAMGTAAAVLDRQLNEIAGFQGLAEKVGDTASAVSSLKLASDVSGVSLDTFAGASVKLTNALDKLDGDSEGVALALKKIGIEVKDFKRLSPVEQFEAVAKALAGFEDGAGKTAVAVQLYGKSGADLIPMLNDLANGSERQNRLTDEQIAGADAYGKATARLRSEIQTMVAVTAADAAPVMTQMVQILRDTLQYSASAAGGVDLLGASMRGVKTALEAVLLVGSDVAYVFKTIGDTAGAYAAVSAALIRGDVAGAKAIGAAYREMSQNRRQALDEYQFGLVLPESVKITADEARKRGRTGGSSRPGLPDGGGGGGGGGGGRRGQSDAEREAQASAEWLRQMADGEDAYRMRLFGKRIDDQQKAEKEHSDWLKEMDAAAGEYVYERNLKRYADEAKAQEDAAKVVAKAQEDQAKSIGDAFAGTFDRAFREGMKLGDLIKKLAFDAINIAFLTPATQKIGKSLGTAASKLFSFDGGGYTGSGSRSGGMDGKGGFMAMLHPNETVLDHTRGQGMGGGGMSFSYSIDARGADAGVEQRVRVALAESERRIRAAIVPTVVSAAGRSLAVAKALGRA